MPRTIAHNGRNGADGAATDQAAAPLLLRPREAAELLGLSLSKVYALLQEGRLPCVRITGSVRIPRAALLELVEAETAWPAR
jgi:excisionase family DNA binding protein